jgi:hypothetical protein
VLVVVLELFELAWCILTVKVNLVRLFGSTMADLGRSRSRAPKEYFCNADLRLIEVRLVAFWIPVAASA